MTDPKAMEAARRIEATRYVGSQFASDARIVARALLAWEGNSVAAGAAPGPPSAETKLREALKPFAEFASRFGAFARDDDWVLTRNPSNKGNLTMGDVRRARAAYAGKDASGEKAGLTQASDSLARPSSSPSPAVRDAPANSAGRLFDQFTAWWETQTDADWLQTSPYNYALKAFWAGHSASCGAVRDVTLREGLIVEQSAKVGFRTAIETAARWHGREPTEKELSELGDVIELNDPIAVLEGDDPYELERAVWTYVASALHLSVGEGREKNNSVDAAASPIDHNKQE
jgi:hypothetical protein